VTSLAFLRVATSCWTLSGGRDYARTGDDVRTVAARHLAGAETGLSALAGSSQRGLDRLTTMQTTIFVPAMFSPLH
jgi:hypothetical protein